MFKLNYLPVLTGILLLSGMLFIGQASWTDCNDLDGDGYGDPASPTCRYSELDCDDTNPDIFPGAPELCDGVDNQCPGDPGYGQVDEGCTGMAQIPSGCFDMGDNFNEIGSDAQPVHTVCITGFEMDVHEVTNAQYSQCVNAAVCTPPARTDSRTRAEYFGNPAYDDYPVIYITWLDADTYCAWAGKRLPTEAEWEYAARGGLVGKRYPWGDTLHRSDANFWDPGAPDENDTTRVARYRPNGFGLFDMAGNVWEWTQDWHDPDYYNTSPLNDPQGPENGMNRVLRGGSLYYDCPMTLRVATRQSRPPTTYVRPHTGVRCAR